MQTSTGSTAKHVSYEVLSFGPSTFLALKVQLVVLVSAFVMVSAVWSVCCLLFFHSRCPRALVSTPLNVLDVACQACRVVSCRVELVNLNVTRPNTNCRNNGIWVLSRQSDTAVST